MCVCVCDKQCVSLCVNDKSFVCVCVCVCVCVNECFCPVMLFFKTI